MSAAHAPTYAELLAEFLPTVIHDDQENEEYTRVLENLAFKEKHTAEEARLIELLSLLIEDYETKHYPIGEASPTEVLEELMAAHSLKQKDLADVFGAESTVSAVLNGKREMTRDHIKRLSDKFGVSPAVFF